MEEAFPIIDYEKYLGCPDTVPLGLLKPHEAQAKTNHQQTLKELSSRGGLSPMEAVAIIGDKRYDDYWIHVDKEQRPQLAVMKLRKLVADYRP